MTESSIIPVFDGHNDALLRLRRGGPNAAEAFLNGEAAGHIDLPRARRGGLAGGLCAIFIPSPDQPKAENADFATPGQPDALNETLAMARLLFAIEAQSGGAVKVCCGSG